MIGFTLPYYHVVQRSYLLGMISNYFNTMGISPLIALQLPLKAIDYN